MNKYLFVFAYCFVSLAAGAKGVSSQEAVRVAANYCRALEGGNFTARAQAVKAVEKDGQACYYIVQFEPEGWALVAADDRVVPVLGYSPAGRYCEDGQPAVMEGWLNGYAEGIKFAISQSKRARHAAWDAEPVATRAATGKIEPFIQVKWNQSAPYNKYCPTNTKGQRALVGCVAVAFAQALSVYQKPEKPVGRNGYTDSDFGLVSVNYDREAPYNWEAIMSGAENNTEAARLLFHCGVAVNMDYGLSASGSYTQRIVRALASYFSYSDAAKYYTRNNYQGDWTQLILNELAAKRPVIYDGANDKGTSAHAFNLDGFDGGNSFHINWGWGGKNNGYFTLENLNDGNFNYVNSHGAVVNIAPAGTIASNLAAKETSNIKVYENTGGEWLLEPAVPGQYHLYTISGSHVSGGAFYPGTQTILSPNHPGVSIYILSLYSEGKKEIRKIIINKN
ncbi:hypothetical protein FACS1894181_08490 [Bacteroidia bacterium]|nr:hypothetical protein FACS1894181_08490 [Bacteroidia bacterium]